MSKKTEDIFDTILGLVIVFGLILLLIFSRRRMVKLEIENKVLENENAWIVELYDELLWLMEENYLDRIDDLEEWRDFYKDFYLKDDKIKNLENYVRALADYFVNNSNYDDFENWLKSNHRDLYDYFKEYKND